MIRFAATSLIPVVSSPRFAGKWWDDGHEALGEEGPDLFLKSEAIFGTLGLSQSPEAVTWEIRTADKPEVFQGDKTTVLVYRNRAEVFDTLDIQEVESGKLTPKQYRRGVQSLPLDGNRRLAFSWGRFGKPTVVRLVAN